MEGKQRRRRSRTRASKRRRLRLESLESRRLLATIVVDTHLDAVDPNDGVTSLREAIQQTNNIAGKDFITFDPGAFAEPAQIDLALGQLRPTDALEIVGPGPGHLVIDAGGSSRVLEFFSYDGDLTLRGLTITGGRTTANDLNSSESGGGIRFVSAGVLTLDQVDVLGNETRGDGSRGGGVFADPGSVVIQRSAITGNRTLGDDSFGGGIFVRSGSLQINESLVSGNETAGVGSRGGGVYSSGSSVTVVDSSIDANRTQRDQADGGGIWTSAALTLQASRVQQNQTLGTDSDGGGLFSTGAVTVTDSDLSFNSTSGIGAGGGGLAVDSAEVTIARSSITGNRTNSQFSYGGGAFLIRSETEIRGSTISSNVAAGDNSDGGGLAIFFGGADINGSTIVNNETSGRAGGVLMFDNTNRRFAFENTIVAKNTDDGTAPDFLAPANPALLTVSSTLIGDNTGTTLNESQQPDLDGNRIGDPSGGGLIDPLLGALHLAGLTRVHPLLPDSPAINAGDNLASGTEIFDQRGEPFVRIFGGRIDIGAFEAQVLDASRLIVDTLEDELNFQNDQVSLRESLQLANGNPGSDSITFDPALIETGSPITLDRALVITDDVSIESPDSGPIVLLGNNDGRVLDVHSEANEVALAGLEVRGGVTTGGRGGGGGIRFQSTGTLALIDTVIRGNQTYGVNASGGGVAAGIGTVSLVRSTIAENTTWGDLAGGGGVHAAGLVATNSTIRNNRTIGTQAHGGGIEFTGAGGRSLSLNRTTVSNNETSTSDSRGGGIAVVAGDSTIVSSTISGNRSQGDGGGIQWFATSVSNENHQLTSSTVANNRSDGVGGGVHIAVPENGFVRVSNSLIATNVSGTSNPDVAISGAEARLILLGNLIGDNSGTTIAEAINADASGNLIGSASGAGVIDPLLSPLEIRGGQTATHALLVGSPAIDAGRIDQVESIATDQRDHPFERVFGSAPDIGSFEVQSVAPQYLIVNTAADEFDNDFTQISLREALAFSEASLGADAIEFDPAVFSSPQVIELRLGPLRISDSVTIDGPGDDLLTIDALAKHRVLDIVGTQADVTIHGVAMVGGLASDGPGGGVRVAENGTLKLTDVTLDSNETSRSDANGGGLYVDGGSVFIGSSRFLRNTTSGTGSGGGAIFVGNAQTEIVDSLIESNRTTADNSEGGGIFAVNGDIRLEGVTASSNVTEGDASGGAALSVNESSLRIISSHIDQNQTMGASPGGGIKADQTDVQVLHSSITRNRTDHPTASGGGAAIGSGSLHVINSTLSNNVANGVNASGGGLFGSNVLARVTNSTITGNTAGFVGGGAAEVALGSLTLENSIVAANAGPVNSPDLFVSLSNPNNLEARFSLIGDRAGTSLQESQTPDANGNRIGSSFGVGLIDPLLGPLQDNGGRVPTHLPLTGSLAIDAGDDTLAVDADGLPLQFDSRDAPLVRRFGTVDQGAVEVQPPREPIIQWSRPENIFVGTPLSGEQLNASTNTDGTFVYTPAIGDILPEGDNQLLQVEFTPSNSTIYAATTASVPISVVSIADRGDAPGSYATRHLDDGPQHAFGGDLYLGRAIDAEADGAASANADGDGDDDDGVTFVTTLLADPDRPTIATVQVEVSRRGKLDAWIDFDGNGRFDHDAEHLFGGQTQSVSTGVNRLSFAIPAGSVAGNTFARFRLSTEGSLLPTGAAMDGEVEDYSVQLVDGATVPVVEIGLALGRTTWRQQADEMIVGRGSRDYFRAPLASVSRIEFTGDSDSNVLTVDASSGNPIPAEGFAFNGVAGVNTIRMIGAGIELDLTEQGNAQLANVDVIDLFDDPSTVIQINAASARSMDPEGNGVIVVGSPTDRLTFADRQAWRMAAPSGVAGLFFSVVRLPDTFLQLDFVPIWQNVIQASDINNDGMVSATDALVIINELSRRIFSDSDVGELVSPAAVSRWPNVYYDQNGDGRATALDALRVINDIARINASGEQLVGASESSTTRTNQRIAVSGQKHSSFEDDEEEDTVGFGGLF